MLDEPIPSRSPAAPAAFGALGGASAAVAFWFVANNVIRIGGKGWLETLIPWPVPGWLVLAAVGAGFGGLVSLVRAEADRKRTAEMAEAALTLGLDYEPSAQLADLGLDDTPLFPDGSSARHRFHGQYNRVPVDMIDLTEVHGAANAQGHNGRSTTERTVVLLPGDGLPDFDLHPRRLVDRVLRPLGISGLEFDPSVVATAAEAEAFRDFSRTWSLSPGNPLVALLAGAAEHPNVVANESSVRRLFSPPLMESLGLYAGWSARSRRGRLALWRGDPPVPASARPELLDQALALRQTLLDGVDAAPEPRPTFSTPQSPVSTIADRARRLVAVALGAVIGMFAGCFAGAVLASWLLFNHLGPGPILMPLAGLGGAALGMTIGAFLGLIAAPFVRLPDLSHPRPRPPASGPWAVAGLFLGFVLGSAGSLGLILGLIHAFGANRLPEVLFFSLFSAGPILGASAGLILGHRIAARRAHRRGSGPDPSGA